MTEISEVGSDHGGPRTIDLHLSMREVLLVHQALRDKEKALRMEAWWLSERVGQDGAADLRHHAQEHADAADRIFRILDGMLGTDRPRGPRAFGLSGPA